jgi:AAA+ ATPase superfamily predicted ATPase
MEKPQHVLNRDREWKLLSEFVADPSPQMRLAIVSGRRRSGKSYLLEALANEAGGLYVTAVQEEGRIPALQRFTRSVARVAGVPSSTLRFDDWEDALTTALDVTARDGSKLLVIDELPYLLQHSPEIPGLLQLLYDRSQSGEGSGGRVILCGSALSVMNDLLSGTKPLRGRAVVDLRMLPFNARTARTHWQIDDPQTALLVDSCLGGAPGYRSLAPGGGPQNTSEFDGWLVDTLLNPGRALYTRVESEFLLREDPRITHRALYYDVLTAVARGATTPAKIGGLLQRERAGIVPPLAVLESTGYVRRDDDLLKPRNPVYRVADPVIRFNQLVTMPAVDLVEHDRAARAWSDARPTFTSKILGPHFEDLAREWTRMYAAVEAGLDLGTTGSIVVPDRAARTSHEVDVVSLAPGERPQSSGSSIALLGEAKATVMPRGMRDVERLEHIRGLLDELGHPASEATLVLYSMHGFHADVQHAAAERKDLRLVDLDAIYGVGPVLGP